MNLVSLLVATSVVKYSHNVGLRTGVAVVAIAIVVAAVVISKRRTVSLKPSGPEQPAALGGAQSPDGSHAIDSGSGKNGTGGAPAEQPTTRAVRPRSARVNSPVPAARSTATSHPAGTSQSIASAGGPGRTRS